MNGSTLANVQRVTLVGNVMRNAFVRRNGNELIASLCVVRIYSEMMVRWAFL